LQARPLQTINFVTYHWFQQYGTSLAAMFAYEKRKVSVSDASQVSTTAALLIFILEVPGTNMR
jgi:hypothetical protein